MAQKPKVNEIMVGMWILALGILVLVFTAALAMVPPGGGRVVSPLLGVYKINSPNANSILANALLWFCMPIPAIVTIEGGLWRLRTGLRIREESLEYEHKTFWSKIGVFFQFYDILIAGLGIIVILVLLAGEVYELSRFPRIFSLNIIMFAAAFLVYAVMRKRLSSGGTSLSKKLLKGFPAYTLTGDGITIKLVTMWNKKRPDPPPVHIRFDEIDQLEVFTYPEAEAFLKYKVGPDLDLVARQTKDFMRYVKGEIPRPSVYAFGGSGSTSGRRVLIRGSGLFYMVTFDTYDISDLIDAYNAHKTPVKEAAPEGIIEPQKDEE